MPTYKVVNADQLDADLKIVADAIRAKGGTSGYLSFPNGMKSAVEAISSGGGGGGGETTYTIKAGKYYFNGYYINYDKTDSDKEFAQNFSGTFEDSGGWTFDFNCLWKAYNEMEFWVVLLYTSTGSNTEINPGTGEFYITTAKDQEVSSAFYEWWSYWSTKVDGGYTLSGAWTQIEGCYDEVEIVQPIEGTVNGISFVKMRFSGEGEPYFYFYSEIGAQVYYCDAYSSYPIIDFGTTEQEVSQAFYDLITTHFTKAGGGSATISAGTYKKKSYTCESYDTGAFNWGEQNVSGKITHGYGESMNVTDEPFNSITNDGNYFVYFNYYGSRVDELSPSDNSDSVAIVVFSEDQTVSSGFKWWWDYCFTKVEDSGETTVTCEVCGGTVPEDSAYYPNFCGDSCYEEYQSNEDSGSGGATISAGTYRVIESPEYYFEDMGDEPQKTESINFTSAETEFSSITMEPGECRFFYNSVEVYANYWHDGEWRESDVYRYITITSDQTVSANLKKWWDSNVEEYS